ncbi:MAG: transposase [Planctomycetaceae bacterium]|nr:transposase [Planctomycetaceae bacterium]
MFYVGLDIHVKWITVCVLDGDGKLHQRSQFRQVDQLVNYLERLPRFEACFEASCSYGWCYELLQPLASRVVVAHPGLLRLIFRSKQKNDRADAEKLAKLLYLGEVPTVHIPTADVRAWRELITFRRKLIEKRTKAKNGIRALLRSLGIQAPQHPGLWTKQGLRWLQQLSFQHALPCVARCVDELGKLPHCG